MKKRILILGASRYYVRSILAARKLGYHVIVTDKNPAADGFRFADHYEVMDISNIEDTIGVAKKYAVDGVVAVNDFGVMTAAVVAKEMGLIGISPKVAEFATSKAWMRRKWEEAVVPSARFRVVKSIDEAYVAVEDLDTWPLILKPADSRGGGSRGVSKIHNRCELKPALEFAQSFYEDKSVVIEEFLSGIEHSVETITYAGETYVLAVSDKEKTPPPYRVDKSVIYPTIFTGPELQKVHETTKQAVQSIGIDTGAAHVEICTTPDGPKLFEIGARCGGGGIPDPIVPFVTGIEMFKEVVRIALGERPHRLIPLHTRGCVYRFLTPKPGILKKVTGIDDVKTWKNILDCGVLVNEGDEVRSVKMGGDRSGFVITGSDTRQSAIALADKAEDYIHFYY